MDQFPLHTLGKTLVIAGGLILVVGLVFLLAGKMPFLGKLPGDISFKGKSFTVYFPIVTCILVSVVLTIIANLIFRK